MASLIVVLVITGIVFGILSAQWVSQRQSSDNTMGSLLISNDSYIKVDYKFGNGVLTQTRDFKELMAEDRETAVDIALADPEVQKMIEGKRYNILSVMDITFSGKKDQERKAVVNINIENQSFIGIVVNMDKKMVDKEGRGAITGTNTTPIEQLTPLTNEEKQKAKDIALADPEVQRMIKDRKYNITFVGEKPFVFQEGVLNRGIIENNTEQEIESGIEPNLSRYMHNKYASIQIIINESDNMKAYMEVDVDLNESVMTRLSFKRR